MIRAFFTLCLAACIGAPLVASAQQGPPPPGNGAPSAPSRRAQFEAIDQQAKSNAYAALSPAHRASVQTVVAGVVAGQTAMRDAARQIDALLTPGESSAVIGIATSTREQMRALVAGAGAPANGGPPNGDAHRAPNAGAFLVRVSLTREQMRALREQMREPRQPAAQ